MLLGTFLSGNLCRISFINKRKAALNLTTSFMPEQNLFGKRPFQRMQSPDKFRFVQSKNIVSFSTVHIRENDAISYGAEVVG